MPSDPKVHRFSFPIPALGSRGKIDLRLRRVGQKQFQCIGVLVVNEHLRFKFRSAGDFEVDVNDPTGLLPQAISIWPQLKQLVETAVRVAEVASGKGGRRA